MKPRAQKKESANLDFLRAVAVLAVFVDHLVSTFGHQEVLSLDLWRLGRLGVLLFFVHTSLVLMMSMDRLNLEGRALFAGFYIRRFFRIYPLSVVFVLATVLLAIPSAPWRPEYHWPGWGALLSNLALSQNLTYSSSVLGPLWSLPYEIQMYLVLPVIWLLLRRYPSLVTTAVLLVVSVAAALAQPHVVGRIDFVKFAPCFMGGIVAFQLSKRRTLELGFWGWPVTIFAAMAGFVLFDESRRGWVTCLALGAAAPQFREMRWHWLRTGSHLIAKYSYGIYLSHIVLMWFAFVYLKQAPAGLQWVLFTALSLALPVAAYHWLEHPMILVGDRVARLFTARRRAARPDMIPVIVGFAVNGWNVYRALARHGVSPVVLDNEPDSIFWRARRARLIHEPELGGAPLIAALNRLASEGGEYVVLSATEEAVRTLSERRADLASNIRLPFPERETVSMLLDKKLFYRQARAGGFRISGMHFLEAWNRLPAPHEMSFPSILKARTKLYAPGLAKAYRLESYAELQECVRRISAIPGLQAADFLIQEWVPGTDADVLFCMQYYDRNSDPKLSFVGRKIRQWRPETGGTASAEAVDDDEALAETTRFFRAAGMHGICSMEFKRSTRNGQLYMIEPTACRADYQEGVAIANGCNIPYAAYCDVAGLPVSTGRPARRPIKWLKFGDDYASASHYVRRGELTWWEWMRSLRGPKSYAVYAPEDRGPFIELMRRKMANRLRRVWAWS